MLPAPMNTGPGAQAFEREYDTPAPIPYHRPHSSMDQARYRAIADYASPRNRTRTAPSPSYVPSTNTGYNPPSTSAGYNNPPQTYHPPSSVPVPYSSSPPLRTRPSHYMSRDPTFPPPARRIRSSDYPPSSSLRRYQQPSVLPPITSSPADMSPFSPPQRDFPLVDQSETSRTVSHSERPNGMDYQGQQFQPPPQPVPLDAQWSASGYYSGGYPAEGGYRG
jgi:hypothetical protein